MNGLTFDIAHLLAGGLVLVSFMMLYQDRLYSLLNMFALHSLVLTLSVAWQAYVQQAPHLYVTATIALVFKAIIIPVALHRMILQIGHSSRDRDRRWHWSHHVCGYGAGGTLHGGDVAGDAGSRSLGA